jgi:hypothetical protein
VPIDLAAIKDRLDRMTDEEIAEVDQKISHLAWVPRGDQMPLWAYLIDGGKRAVEVAHRRWGKDEIGMRYIREAAYKGEFSVPRVGNYWHMLPKAEQCRKAIWEAVNPHTGKRRVDECFPVEERSQTRESDMFIRWPNGSTYQLVGSDNYNNLIGSPPVGLLFSEYAVANPQAWAILSPILEENGGWAAFISTSRGNNHLKQMHDYARVAEGWFAQLTPATQTPVFTAVQLEHIRSDLIGLFGQEFGEAMFNQEYLCSWEGATLGSYYGKQMAFAKQEGRITSVPWASGLEVFTFWDLGIDDSMTVWFGQFVGRERRWIDYYENTGYGLEHYAKVLKEKPYVYGRHYLPHDAAHRQLGGGEYAKTSEEILNDLGIKPTEIVQRPRDGVAVINGINLVRNALSQCWFDEKKCWQGISALETYHAEYDEVKKVLKNNPAHTWESHAADAMRTFGVGFSEVVRQKGGELSKVRGGSWRAT